MSSEIIPNNVISFISAQLTQILGVLITTGKPAKWRPEPDGENGNANIGIRNRVVSRLSARFPVLKWRSRHLAKPLYYPWEWLASNFSLQYQSWNKHWGLENKENDHQLLKILLDRQVILLSNIGTCKWLYGEYAYWFMFETFTSSLPCLSSSSVIFFDAGEATDKRKKKISLELFLLTRKIQRGFMEVLQPTSPDCVD